jgi:FkbM family methyltransferase
MSRNENWVKQFIHNLPVQENGIALDIGANHGIYTKILADKFSTVYAFEPHPNNVSKIKTNVTNENVNIEQKVVGTSDEITTLFVCKSNSGGHTIMKGLAEHSKWGHSTTNKIEVESVTLDTFCEDKKIDFIKCDIEGGEYEIFYHGEKTLTRDYPTIILETHQVSNIKSDQVKRDKLFAYFKDLSFSILDTKNNEVKSLTFDTHYLIQK